VPLIYAEFINLKQGISGTNAFLYSFNTAITSSWDLQKWISHDFVSNWEIQNFCALLSAKPAKSNTEGNDYRSSLWDWWQVPFCRNCWFKHCVRFSEYVRTCLSAIHPQNFGFNLCNHFDSQENDMSLHWSHTILYDLVRM
jgi:hypothetical protein